MAKIQGSHEIINDLVYNLQDCKLNGNTYKCTGFSTYSRREGLEHWIFKIKPGVNKIDDFSFSKDKIDLRAYNYQCEDIIQTITQEDTEIKTKDNYFKIPFDKVYAPIDCDIFLFSNPSDHSEELVKCNLNCEG